ncbi:MAG TPA: hypothetical protein VHW45_08380 [Candidatus Sulfotelmatobacter sp.]|nr:hypothetical protein [Candidatus Sulfotelmatobacter sp.]
MDALEILGTKQLKQERGYLRQIAEDVFYLSTKTVEFGALDHYKLVAENRLSGASI